MRKIDVTQISGKVILLNLYITQGIALIIALGGLYFFSNEDLLSTLRNLFITTKWPKDILLGLVVGNLIIITQFILYRYLPSDYFDDGGINKKLFRYLHPIFIFLVSLLVSIVEELLFRGLIQNHIGLFWTSSLFTLIHFRYLHQWFMTSIIFLMSLLIGWVYIIGESLLAPISAHFLIDFILGLSIHFKWISKEKDLVEEGEGREYE